MPITLATVPATVVSLAIVTCGVRLVRRVFAGTPEVFADSWWAAIGPTLIFPVGAVGPGWASFSYWNRGRPDEAEK